MQQKKKGRGTVIFNWSPNFTDATGFTFIDFPPYFEGCRIENGGTLETTGCGSPKGWLKKAAHIKVPNYSSQLRINFIQKCHSPLHRLV
jgi:glycine betaine/proline transport system substrate-binding protein